MALRAQSLFLYGFQVDASNSSLDFRSSSGGPIRLGTLKFGSYSLGGLLSELKRAMEAADPSHKYTWTVDRTLSGGTQNRLTVVTNGIYLDLLFLTGPRVTSSIHPLLGFHTLDYSAALTYTGFATAGTGLVSFYAGYNFLSPDMERTVFGSVSVSASGEKEAVVWQIQQFTDVEFKYEPEAKVITEWRDFFVWAIQQKKFEFTPEITTPTRVFDVTLESTSADGKGLGFRMKEMLPEFPFFYQTGNIKMRVKV